MLRNLDWCGIFENLRQIRCYLAPRKLLVCIVFYAADLNKDIILCIVYCLNFCRCAISKSVIISGQYRQFHDVKEIVLLRSCIFIA